MHSVLRFRYVFSIVLIQLSLVCLSEYVFSQGVSEFQLLPSTQDVEPFHEALSTADLESYRFKDSDRTIAFSAGIEFKLRSAEALQALGQEIDPSGYPSSSDVDPAITLVFNLTDDGRLGVTSQIDARSKLATIGAGYPENLKKIIPQAEFDQLPEAKQAVILANPDKYLVR